MVFHSGAEEYHNTASHPIKGSLRECRTCTDAVGVLSLRRMIASTRHSNGKSFNVFDSQEEMLIRRVAPDEKQLAGVSVRLDSVK